MIFARPNSKAAPRKAFRRRRWLRVLAAFLLFAPLAVHALEPTTPLANYARQSWVMENGLLQNTIHALAQTSDGFIWLGTEVGLARFDGYNFTVYDRNSTPALPDADIRCLLAAKDGSLWIGTGNGLARWKDGAVTSFTTKNGLPGNVILGLVQDDAGTFWVMTDQAPAYLSGSRFTAKYTFDAVSQKFGSFLTGGMGFVGQLPGNIFVERDRNSLTLTKEGSHSRVLTKLSTGKDLPGNRIQTAVADRQGALWIGTNGGLVRWFAGKIQRFPLTDPLASASILSILEDREGDLWVGTETSGLHILRDQRFRTIGAREGLSSDSTTTVVEDTSGRLWVGTGGNGLNVFSHHEHATGPVLTYSVANGLLSDIILSLAAAPDGGVWVGTPDGLNRIRNGAVSSYTSADGLPDDFIRSLLPDPDGSLWIGTRRGLTHWLHAGNGGQMHTYTKADGLGSDLVGAMARDAQGSLWVATLAGLSRIVNGKIENYTTANGLSSNVVTALLPRGGQMLIGTQDSGWNVWDGKAFSRSAHRDDDPANAAIHAILADSASHLWFATGTGIARCDCDQACGCSHWMEFGAADGLRSRATATNSHPSAWRSRDGYLWFATPKGLLEVDPAHFPINTIPPPVAIERLSVDDLPMPLHAADSGLKIPPGKVHFEFDYAGLSFVTPQKVRYRYMLEGFDRGWTDAGPRRTAYYTNIPPGRYTFRVQAANNDGLWNTQGAALTFELRPHFYQTLWFYLLLAATAAALIVLLLRRRLRVAEREFSAVLGERNRIAREIHDTLAQGYVGVSVQLELLAEFLRLKKLDAAEQQLDTTRGYVRQGLADARQSIWALRSQDSGETTLPVRLRRMVESDCAAGMDCRFNIFGAYRPLSPGTEREILRIAQEAIHNVRKHAGARHLAAQLEYGPAHISLEVRDDGRGFDSVPESKPGHYGLTGMRERAAAIGGTLEVTSEPGGGTAVRLRAPTPREKTGEPV